MLDANGIGAEYCPTVHIIDSEMLDMDMRMDLAKMLYATFSVSRETAFGMVGIDVEDERVKREKEDADGLNDIFIPYATSFNSDGSSSNDDESEPGRPRDSEDPEKQGYDEEYNKTRE